jgi:hypothetical protein
MTQFNAPTYDIERPSGQCVFTGRALQPGEPYVAALVEFDPPPPPPDGKPAKGDKATTNPGAGARNAAAAGLGMKRLDISIEAWTEGRRPERLFSHWRSTVPQPNQKRKMFVDDEVLMNLFRRLADADQPERLAFRFVLGLILMRKKLLRYDGPVRRQVGEQMQEWWKLSPKNANAPGYEPEPLELLDPHLDDQKIQQVTAQLSEILEAEL